MADGRAGGGISASISSSTNTSATIKASSYYKYTDSYSYGWWMTGTLYINDVKVDSNTKVLTNSTGGVKFGTMSGSKSITKTHSDQSIRCRMKATCEDGSTLDKSVYVTVSAKPKYTYTYSNGSGTTSTQTHWYGEANTTKSASTFSKTGYTFSGWKGSNGTTYSAGSSINVNSNLTLTAIWTAITYTVTLNYNDGSTPNSTKTKTYGSALTLPSPTRTGYTFSGWKNSSGTNIGTTYSTNASTTLTAIWTAITSTLKINKINNDSSTSEQSFTVTYNSKIPKSLTDLIAANKIVYSNANNNLSTISDYTINEISIYSSSYVTHNTDGTYTWIKSTAGTYTLNPTYIYQQFSYTFYWLSATGNILSNTIKCDIRNNSLTNKPSVLPNQNINNYNKYKFNGKYIEYTENTPITISDFKFSDIPNDTDYNDTKYVCNFPNLVNSNKKLLACYTLDTKYIPTNTFYSYSLFRTSDPNILTTIKNNANSNVLTEYIDDTGSYLAGYIKFTNSIQIGDTIKRPTTEHEITIESGSQILDSSNNLLITYKDEHNNITNATVDCMSLNFSNVVDGNTNYTYILFGFNNKVFSAIKAYDFNVSGSLKNIYTNNVTIPLSTLNIKARYLTLDINQNANVLAFGGEANDYETTNQVTSYVPIKFTEKTDNETELYFSQGIISNECYLGNLDNGIYMSTKSGINLSTTDNKKIKLQKFDRIEISKIPNILNNNPSNYNINVTRGAKIYHITVTYLTATTSVVNATCSENSHNIFMIYKNTDDVLNEIIDTNTGS